MLHIALTGPENSGKTTLAAALAAHYGVPWVPEYAREYLDQSQGRYEEKDLPAIARGQLRAGLKAGADHPVLFHDTDMITIRIWAKEKFGRVHPEIEGLMQETYYDHWLLCRPDIPWEPDPLRENPNDRDRLFMVYERTLQELARSYTIIEGPHEERMRKATAIIDVLNPRRSDQGA